MPGNPERNGLPQRWDFFCHHTKSLFDSTRLKLLINKAEVYLPYRLAYRQEDPHWIHFYELSLTKKLATAVQG
jgi:hypothetical protein